MSYVQIPRPRRAVGDSSIASLFAALTGGSTASVLPVPNPTKDQLIAMQSGINTLLATKGCAKIGTDGSAGPETCGAMKYLNDNQLNVPANLVGVFLGQWPKCTTFKYSCAATGASTTPPAVTAANLAPLVIASGGKWYTDPTTMAMALTGVAAVGLVVYAMLQKRKKV
jgi:hypothetical protein